MTYGGDRPRQILDITFLDAPSSSATVARAPLVAREETKDPGIDFVSDDDLQIVMDKEEQAQQHPPKKSSGRIYPATKCPKCAEEVLMINLVKHILAHDPNLAVKIAGKHRTMPCPLCFKKVTVSTSFYINHIGRYCKEAKRMRNERKSKKEKSCECFFSILSNPFYFTI